MAKFVATGSSKLRLVLIPDRFVVDPTTHSRSIVKGKDAQFEQGNFETEDEQIVALLRKHPGYKISFTEIVETEEQAEIVAQPEAPQARKARARKSEADAAPVKETEE